MDNFFCLKFIDKAKYYNTILDIAIDREYIYTKEAKKLLRSNIDDYVTKNVIFEFGKSSMVKEIFLEGNSYHFIFKNQLAPFFKLIAIFKNPPYQDFDFDMIYLLFSNKPQVFKFFITYFFKFYPLFYLIDKIIKVKMAKICLQFTECHIELPINYYNSCDFPMLKYCFKMQIFEPNDILFQSVAHDNFSYIKYTCYLVIDEVFISSEYVKLTKLLCIIHIILLKCQSIF